MKLVIDLFVKYYKVDMKEVQKLDIVVYCIFNDFFVCLLCDDVCLLNIDLNVLVMLVDGVISQFGVIENDKILQVKGYDYSLEVLLVGNYQMVDLFCNGSFVIIYLLLCDYYCVYMLCNGILCEMIYVSGDLFFVNYLMVQNVLNLFVCNECVICLFDIEFGLMV